MKLTSEHIGRKIKIKDTEYTYTLLAVDGEQIWTKRDDGTHIDFGNTGWELVEDPKMPSTEIMRGMNGAATCCDLANAICIWLDENWDKRK